MAKGDLSHVDLTIRDPEVSAPFYDAVLKFLKEFSSPLRGSKPDGDIGPVYEAHEPVQAAFVRDAFRMNGVRIHPLKALG